MEDVLETYKKPCDKRFPVLCMDEQPVQLLKETRVPIPASKKHARRVDYEYERNGTASIFMFAEPLKGWRQVRVRPQRTKVDWALEMKELLTTPDRAGRTRALPRRSTAARKRSRTSGSAWSGTDSRSRSTASNANPHREPSCSMGNRRPSSSRCGWAAPPRASPTGRSGCSHKELCNWRSWIPSVRKPSARP